MIRLFSLLLTGTVLLCGCSLPRIIVLNDPLDARQHNDLGVAYEARGDYDLAQRAYRRAAELESGWAVPWINLGNVHARQAAWEAATDSYRRALQSEPASVAALNNLAWALVRSGRPDEALPLAERAVTLAADNPECWDTLAEAYLALDRPDEARAAAARGLALDPPPELRVSLEEKQAPADRSFTLPTLPDSPE